MSGIFLALFRTVLFRAAHGRGHKCYLIQIPLYISHTDKTCYRHNLAKGDPKNIKTYKITLHTPSVLQKSAFFTKK